MKTCYFSLLDAYVRCTYFAFYYDFLRSNFFLMCDILRKYDLKVFTLVDITVLRLVTNEHPLPSLSLISPGSPFEVLTSLQVIGLNTTTKVPTFIHIQFYSVTCEIIRVINHMTKLKLFRRLTRLPHNGSPLSL